ncbi:ElyC/SanA/YdcF family protein [Colwellia sp. 4_MG-2023]|uniref:ElyC/SanA/YdcF family protein n=1 Tax=unclassified Colwellia TaxID=196834 RepID=UPI0026E24872|nr:MULTISPECIES: ElyC/SanA/YdcF family protein [unclassified Colwellia]MDO6507891.1 ElyC/SanA/YdcF family protein [Colwellia sp. 5_MG-2023]MDO6556556.1 ElyC/SanA/YdcF family protein [Colwellia sp. 4_MG-2023]
MDLFLLKKVISAAIMPINLVLILLTLSLLYCRKRPKRSVKYLISAVLLLTISSMPVVSDKLMVNIENKYESFTHSSKPVDYIIVLGGWHVANDALPVTSQLNTNSLERLVEVLRIYQLHPEATIITSGYYIKDQLSHAQTMKQSLVLLGVPANKIMTENFPKDTEEEAQLIGPRVQGHNVVLVTNASHMLRAIKYFQAQGVEPIPAPTGFMVKNINGPKGWGYYVPKSKSLQITTAAWYESLGLFVQWLKSLL